MTTIDDAALVRRIEEASRRIVLLAPGLSVAVADALAAQWRRMPGRVTVVLDADEEVFRLGLGELAAIESLKRAADALGETVDRQPGVRIGVLLVDDTTIIWAPTPQLVEAPPRPDDDPRHRRPNAIQISGSPPPPALTAALGAGPAGLRERSVGLECIETDRVGQLQQRLRENPPQRFDLSRRVRLFNAFFQFVDFELLGVRITRRTVRLPSDLFGLVDPETRRQLHASFQLVAADDALSGRPLMEDRQRLARRFLRPIIGYGTTILRRDKPAFEEAVTALRTAVERFRTQLESTLQGRMDAQREHLVAALLPAVLRNPPPRYRVSAFFESGRPASVATLLRDDLRLAFGDARRLIGGLAVRVVFKDVTYESLRDEGFMAKVRAAIPELDAHYHEQDATPAQPAPVTA